MENYYNISKGKKTNITNINNIVDCSSIVSSPHIEEVSLKKDISNENT